MAKIKLIKEHQTQVDIFPVTHKDAVIGMPTKVSELDNDSGFIKEELEPQFTASPAATITAEKMLNWDEKSKIEVVQEVEVEKTSTTAVVSQAGLKNYFDETIGNINSLLETI